MISLFLEKGERSVIVSYLAVIENDFEYRNLTSYAVKDDDIPQYQSISNLTTPYLKGEYANI